MSRKTLTAVAIFGIALTGSALPALAAAPASHVCLIATHDKSNPGPSTICVVVPVVSSAAGSNAAR